MQRMEGMVVKSLKGHDQGSLFAVVKSDRTEVYLVDGKRRRWANPKKKNLKHIVILNESIPDFSNCSDKSVRKQLNRLKENSKS